MRLPQDEVITCLFPEVTISVCVFVVRCQHLCQQSERPLGGLLLHCGSRALHPAVNFSDESLLIMFSNLIMVLPYVLVSGQNDQNNSKLSPISMSISKAVFQRGFLYNYPSCMSKRPKNSKSSQSDGRAVFQFSDMFRDSQ